MKFLRTAKENEQKSELYPYDHPAQNVPEVFVFVGRGNETDTPEDRLHEVHNFLSIIEEKLAPAIAKNKVAVGGIQYREVVPASRMMEYYANPEGFVSPDAKHFVDKVLMPRLLASDATPSVTTLIDRMSRITFVTHSYGGPFAHQVCNELRNQLSEKGYDPKEIAEICGAAVQISTAGPNIVRTTQPNFCALNFRNTRDEQQINAFNERIPLLRQAGIDPEEMRTRIGLTPPVEDAFSCQRIGNGAVVFSPLPATMVYESGGTQTQIGEHGTPPQSIRHHLVPHWYPPVPNKGTEDRWPGDSAEPNNGMAVKIKVQALENAIKRGPGTPDPITLLSEGNKLSTTERAQLSKEIKQRQGTEVQ